VRWRKVTPGFWRDGKVRQLSPPEKLVALYCLTAQSNRIGLFSFSPGQAIEELDAEVEEGSGNARETSRERFMKRFSRVVEILNWKWDDENRVLYIPTWWKYNCPQNPNDLKGSLKDVDELPETPLLPEFASNLTHLPELFHQTFTERFVNVRPTSIGTLPKPLANQEQEQEQEKEKKREQKKEQKKASPCDSANRPDDPLFFTFSKAFLNSRKIPYEPKRGDFVQLAALRKRLNVNGEVPEGWHRAIRNYFDSPLSDYTLAQLCTRYDVFLNDALDRFNKPAHAAVHHAYQGDEDYTGGKYGHLFQKSNELNENREEV
jgi:hypothetical protein